MHKARIENAGNDKTLGQRKEDMALLSSYVNGQQLEWLLFSSLIQKGLFLLQELFILCAAT